MEEIEVLSLDHTLNFLREGNESSGIIGGGLKA